MAPTTLRAGLLALLAALLQIVHPASAGPAWSQVHAQTEAQAGIAGKQPSIRYGHSISRNKEQLIMTHGYYFDRVHGVATWMSDSWAM
jgi:hypothetical protein